MVHKGETENDPKVTNPDNKDYQPSEDKFSKTEMWTKKYSKKRRPMQDKSSEQGSTQENQDKKPRSISPKLQSPTSHDPNKKTRLPKSTKTATPRTTKPPVSELKKKITGKKKGQSRNDWVEGPLVFTYRSNYLSREY